jgi:hypothetical protein
LSELEALGAANGRYRYAANRDARAGTGRLRLRGGCVRVIGRSSTVYCGNLVIVGLVGSQPCVRVGCYIGAGRGDRRVINPVIRPVN